MRRPRSSRRDEIIVIGSHAILGTYGEDELPLEAPLSIEVDMAPMDDDDAGALATLLDDALGELSAFHKPTASTSRESGANRRCCRSVGTAVWCRWWA